MLSSIALALLAVQSAPTFSLERYEVDAHSSTVGFDGVSPLHDFTGKTHAITGDLRADSSDLGRLAGGVVWIDAATLDTDNGSRDKEMRELLDVKHCPHIVFHLDSVQGKHVNGREEFTAQGRFTIKGVEKARVVNFHVDPIPHAKDVPAALRVQGELRFKMTDHGIERPGILMAKVTDEVRVWLDLTLRPVPDAGAQALVRTLQVEEEFTPKTPGAVPTKSTGTEFAWTIGAQQLWERRLQPVWALKDEHELVAFDARNGRVDPPAEIMKRALAEFAKPGIAGTTWTTSVEEADGKRRLLIKFGEEQTSSVPTWALHPRSWSNGPALAR